jgi:cobalamin biosynthesis protein CbiG
MAQYSRRSMQRRRRRVTCRRRTSAAHISDFIRVNLDQLELAAAAAAAAAVISAVASDQQSHSLDQSSPTLD